MDVAVTRMPEAGHRQAMCSLKADGEPKEIVEPTARDDDVFIQLREAGITQRVENSRRNLPNFLAGFGTERLAW